MDGYTKHALGIKRNTRPSKRETIFLNVFLIGGSIIFWLALVWGLFSSLANGSEVTSKAPVITTIYWSDGDSGRINGNLKFRLANIDAPETGGVGASIGGAKCEKERKLGYETKAYIVGITKNSKLIITKDFGYDKYERLVIDLTANGIDVGVNGIKNGFLKPWPHKGRRQLIKKPNWCVTTP